MFVTPLQARPLHVPRQWAESGHLPNLCTACGTATDRRTRVTIQTVTTSVLLGRLGGGAHASLPFCARCSRRDALLQAVAVVGLLLFVLPGAIGLGVLGYQLLGNAGGWIGALGSLAAAVAIPTLAEWRKPSKLLRGTLSDDGWWVVLRSPDPAFAGEVDRALQATWPRT